MEPPDRTSATGVANDRGHGDEPPVLSICVPTYNRPDLVERALGSIIADAAGLDSSVEIVVSDNSPDVSEATCRRALAAWPGPSVYLANRPDIGLVANLNQCIATASGRYILFVHDDDWLLPDGLGRIVKVLREADGGHPVLFFGVHLVDASGRVSRRQEFDHEQWVAPRDAVRRLLSDNRIAWFPGLVIDRAAWQAAGPFAADVGNATDLEMWVRLLSRHGVRCLPGAVSAYTVHAASVTQTMAFSDDTLQQLEEIFRRASELDVLSAAELRRSESSYLHQVILGATYGSMRQGDGSTARATLRLVDHPTLRALGRARPWGPVVRLTSLAARLPGWIVRPVVAIADRLDLARWLAVAGGRGPERFPFA